MTPGVEAIARKELAQNNGHVFRNKKNFFLDVDYCAIKYSLTSNNLSKDRSNGLNKCQTFVFSFSFYS